VSGLEGLCRLGENGAATASALERAPPDRVCAALNRRGEPCRARAVLADGFCSMHSPARVASPQELGRRGGLASGEVRREQGRSVRDRLRERVEAEADEVWRVYRQAMDAAADDGDPDHRARLASVEGVLAQAYGRPAATIVGEDDRPLSFRVQREGVPASLVAVFDVLRAAGALEDRPPPVELPASGEAGS
jgi:hypothetical protein